ncbi:hypothetical protein H920_12902 [Fukomys damarensis]|uniref:Uncharacterized protein n=1 Tax=Fukomys damarensis TaxID=885580 RepID=A0A091DSL4_FUKDA|nr:hypothetical protein H920_12902 [Fukomys damarensis]
MRENTARKEGRGQRQEVPEGAVLWEEADKRYGTNQSATGFLCSTQELSLQVNNGENPTEAEEKQLPAAGRKLLLGGWLPASEDGPTAIQYGLVIGGCIRRNSEDKLRTDGDQGEKRMPRDMGQKCHFRRWLPGMEVDHGQPAKARQLINVHSPMAICGQGRVSSSQPPFELISSIMLKRT